MFPAIPPPWPRIAPASSRGDTGSAGSSRWTCFRRPPTWKRFAPWSGTGKGNDRMRKERRCAMERVLLTGGRIFTLDAERPEAEGLYVEKGRIVAAGDREEVELQHGRAGVRGIDLQGGFAVPGLVDSHRHLAMFGRKYLLIDFARARSKGEMLRLLRGRVAKTPPGKWILGSNWDEKRCRERMIANWTPGSIFPEGSWRDRKSTRLNCRHVKVSY